MVGARLREQAPGWCLFPVYWFPEGEQALLPKQHGAGGREAWGPGCQPAPKPGLLGLPRPLPPPSPLGQTSSPFPGQGIGGQGADVKGRDRRIGKDSPYSPQKILLAPSLDSLCHCSLAPGSSLSLSLPVSLGWGLV